jgi:putative SOS response-associated peptidase YedK
MCGRYTLTIVPTYNATPSQMLPMIRTYRPDTIELGTWDFWPESWKRSKHPRLPINSRLAYPRPRPLLSN